MIFDLHRLVRESWGTNVDLFAQELIAVLESAKNGINGPLIIETEGNEPPLIFRMPNGTEAPPIEIHVGGDIYGVPGIFTGFDPLQPPLVPPSPPPPPFIGPPAGGGPDIGAIDWPENTDPETVPDPTTAPFPLYGEVQSGSGDTYQVKVWGRPPSSFGPMGVVTCTVPGMDADEALEPGFKGWVLVYPDGNRGISQALFYPIALFQ